MEAVLERVIAKHRQLLSLPPLSVGSQQSLRNEFMVRYVYETTALEGNSHTLEETRTRGTLKSCVRTTSKASSDPVWVRLLTG